MEAIIVVLAALLVILLQRIRSVNKQLDKAQTKVASSEKQVDELEAQMMAVSARIGLETRRSSELEEEFSAVREILVAANNHNDTLAEKLQEVSESKTQQNDNLVVQLRAARREIRELRKVIADQDEKSRLNQADHSELYEQNVKLKKQLNDLNYALSKETSLGTKVTTERRQHRRRVESESQKRSEIEEQLRSALLEVQRLSKDLRKLKSDHKKQMRLKSADAQHIASLESLLRDSQMELSREFKLRNEAELKLEIASRNAEDSALQASTMAEKLTESSHTVNRLIRQTDDLKSELEQLRHTERYDEQQKSELERALKQAMSERADKVKRNAQLTVQLASAQKKANRTAYDNLIHSAIDTLIDAEPLLKKAMEIGARPSKSYDLPSKRTIRAAEKKAHFVEQIIIAAIKLMSDSSNIPADEPQIEDQVKARIDDEIVQTRMKVADIISFGRRTDVNELLVKSVAKDF